MERCPICGASGGSAKLDSADGYMMYRCGACDVVYADPFKSPGPEWYENSELYSVGRVITKGIEWYQREVLRMRPQGKRLLDIGCGSGTFISEAGKLGYEVWGVDFDKSNIALAEERYGLRNVHCLSVADVKKKFGKNMFDVVTFFEVLEHLDAPAAFLQDVKDLLSQNGIIALSVPNRDRFLDTLGAGDAPPNHLTKWNAKSLRRFLDNMGFTVISLVEKPLDRSDLNIYLKGKIRFRIAHNLVREGIDSGDGARIKKARYLMKIKDAVFGALTYPPGMILRLLNLKGSGMVCIARVKT